MKKILLGLFLIFNCNSLYASWAFVQGTSTVGDPTSTTIELAYTSNITAGNFLVVSACAHEGTSITASMSDTVGTTLTWTAAGSVTRNSSLGFSCWIFYSANVPTSEAHTPRVTFSATVDFRKIAVNEYSGIATTSPNDVNASSTGNSTAMDSTSATTTVANELVYGWGINGGASSITAGTTSITYTSRELLTNGNVMAEDGNQTSAASVNATETSNISGNWIMMMATFKPSGGGSSITASIRHEINILDSILSATSGNAADSNEIVQLNTNQYSVPTYYFEGVVDSASSLSFTVTLRRKGTTTDDATLTIPLLTTAYTLIRSSSFTPPAGSTEYMVHIDNTVGATKNIKSARIIIIDNGSISSSEVQVEVGNNESFTSTTPATLTNPKYWLYTSANWDGSPTFYAEATYKAGTNTNATTLSSTQTWTSPYVITSAQIEVWGGGANGSQGSSGSSTRGGGGGGGGGYAKKNAATLTINTGYSVTVGATQSTSQTNGNNSSFPADSGTITGNGGAVVANSSTGGAGGTGTGGDTNNTGGAGGTNSNTNNTGGAGGGESGCTTGTGNAGSANSTSTGGAGGTGCDGGDGGRGGDNSTNSGIAAGSVPGGGGGGSGGSSNVTGNGAAGQVKISYTSAVKITLQEDNGSFASWADIVTIVAAGTASSNTRIRSSSFTPTNGRHYRIAVVRSDSGISPAIYNAKIIIDQSSFTKLEEYYQLTNTLFASGTGLQTSLSKWDSTEWSGFGNQSYYHTTSSAAGTSVVEADTAGGTQITGSSLTASSVYTESSSLTMPSNQNIDTKATTNNSDIYGNRIKTIAAPSVSAIKRLTVLGVGDKQ